LEPFERLFANWGLCGKILKTRGRIERVQALRVRPANRNPIVEHPHERAAHVPRSDPVIDAYLKHVDRTSGRT
jgi:hypothetical protein